MKWVVTLRTTVVGEEDSVSRLSFLMDSVFPNVEPVTTFISLLLCVPRFLV